MTLSPHPQGLAVGKYTVSDTNNSAVVNVLDDDSRTIAVSTEYTSVPTGSDLVFSVSVFPAPAAAIEVPVTASDNTNSSLVIEPSTIQVGESGEVTARVSTLNTSTGNVTLTLGSVDTYNSAPAIVVPIETPSVTATLSIQGASEPVLEGESAIFTLNASRFADKDVTVEVDVKDLAAKATNFVENKSHYIRFPKLTSRMTFSIPTKRESAESSDGVIVATLVDGIGYSPTSEKTAYVEVQDKQNVNAVTLSVAPKYTEIYEGEDAIFIVTRTGATTNALAFKYDIIDTGNVIDNEGTGISGTIASGRSSVELPGLTTKTGLSLTANSGVNLRIQSVTEDLTLEYRVASQVWTQSKGISAVKTRSDALNRTELYLGGGHF